MYQFKLISIINIYSIRDVSFNHNISVIFVRCEIILISVYVKRGQMKFFFLFS